MMVAASTLGISDFSDDMAHIVASDVEYRLREVVQEALKFTKHAKRSALSSSDIDQALRVLGEDPVFGFSSREPLRFCKTEGEGKMDLYFVEDNEVFPSYSPFSVFPLPIIFFSQYHAHGLKHYFLKTKR